ncbi:MAG: MFS transporter [Negativicutes bacterium]|nr:MFS transporter [Negativicutes bacterium]
MNPTTLVYLIFWFIGVSFNMAGVLAIEMAKTFQVDTAVIGYVFSLFSAGYSAAILVNGFRLDRADMRRTMLGAVLLAFVGIGAAASCSDALPFAVAILGAGIGLGVLCSCGNYYIISSFHGCERSAKLNILNFFYGFGATLSPAATGQLLKLGATWEQVYFGSLAPVAIIGFAALNTPFTSGVTIKDDAEDDPGEARGAGVYLIAAALFAYVAAETILVYWIVVYFVEQRGLPLAEASLALSLFWAAMAGGRLLTGYLAGKARPVHLILYASGAAFLTFVLMLQVADPYWAIALTALTGLGFSGLYATILAFGTMQRKKTCPRLITFFVTVGSVGSILSFLLSSFLKEHFTVYSSLLVSLISLGLVFIFTAAAGRSTR